MNIYEALFEPWLVIVLSDYIYLFEVKLDQSYTKKGGRWRSKAALRI